MKLFTVSMEGYTETQFSQLCDRLVTEADYLHKRKNERKWQWEQEGLNVSCVIDEKKCQKNEQQKLVEAFGRTMSRFLIDALERDLLRDTLNKMYKASDQAEKQVQFVNYCLSLFYENDPHYEEDQEAGIERRSAKLSQHFEAFVEQQSYLHLQGFIRFRMKDYMEELRSFAEYAAEEYIVDQQYNEFISLLKYFVCEQEVRRPAVHIFHRKGNEFLVLDEEYRPIDTEEVNELIVETVDKEMNLEDMIISTLISVSPKIVYIHTDEPEMQVVRTIRMIFEERAVLC